MADKRKKSRVMLFGGLILSIIVIAMFLFAGFSAYKDLSTTETNAGKVITLYICFGLVSLLFLFMFFYFIIALIKTRNPERLGKKTIEYYGDGCLIEVYNSPICCSLLVNEKVVSQVWLVDVPRDGVNIFHHIDRTDRRVTILLKLTIFKAYLYYDNKLVFKKTGIW